MSNPNDLAQQFNGMSLSTHTPPYQQPAPAAAPNDLDQRLGALSLNANATTSPTTTTTSPTKTYVSPAEQERRDAEYARALHAQELENAKAAAATSEASRRAAAERAEREKKAAQERKDRELAERLQRTEAALAAQPAARSPPVSPVSPHAVCSGASVLPPPPHYEAYASPSSSPSSSRSTAQHAWHFRDNSNTERAYAVHQSKAIEAAYQLFLRQPADVQAAWDGVVLNHGGTHYAIDWKAWRQTRLTALGTPALAKQCVRSIARHPLFVDTKPAASSFVPNFAVSRQLQFDSANHAWQNYSAPMSKAADRMSQLGSTHALHALLPAMLLSTRSAHAHHNTNRHVQSYALMFDANRQQNLETNCVRSLRRVNLPGHW